MAREINLQHIFNRPSARRTRDIDIAISVNNWVTFNQLKDTLQQNNVETTKETYRLLCSDTRIPLDIIPFSKISDNNEDISWPPEHAITMSVSGFEEACQSALTLSLAGNTIKLASLPGLTLLKLIAWHDRRLLTKKDAIDFFTIMSEYQHIETERLYDNHVPATQLQYDISRLGAWVLGADTRLVCQDNTVIKMRSIRTRKEQLIDDLFRVLSAQNTNSLEVLVQDFWRGFENIN